MKAVRTALMWLGAFAPVVPTGAMLATVVLYLVDWPDDGNRGLQLAVGLGIGLAAWVLVSFVAGSKVTSVTGASSETYQELRGRVLALDGRLAKLTDVEGAQKPFGREAIASAGELVKGLHADLELDGSRARWEDRWLQRHGYINAWREVHRTEDLLLAVEPKEVVYAAALTNLDRLKNAGASPATKRIAEELDALVKGNGKAKAARTGAEADLVSLLEFSATQLAELGAGVGEHKAKDTSAAFRFESDEARAIVRESAYRLHKSQNDAWDKLVNLRSRLMLALSLSIALGYGLLVLLVLQPGDRDVQLTAAAAFFLVGAVVGIFNELWSTSQMRTGTVFDYGLAQVRLLATPVLSGLAALGGVVVTNIAGSYLFDAGAGQSDVTLGKILDLGHYQAGLIVAAIFGLTPGLFLERLKARQDEYEKQITNAADATDKETATRCGVA